MNWNGPTRKRPLTAEEAELWAFAMRQARALRREQNRHEAGMVRRHGAEAAPAPTAVKAEAQSQKPVGEAQHGAPCPPPGKPIEEAELWALATREARALRREQNRHKAGVLRRDGAEAAPPAPAMNAAAQSQQSLGAAHRREPSAPGKTTQHPANTVKSPPPLARYNERERRKLSRDAELIDARLDLHGMRQREAHSALRRFLLACHSRGDRHVLVITGKGAPAETGMARLFAGTDERGVLRRLVPQWLGDADLRSLVVSYAAASARHGGDGALYVRLRKAASKP